MHMNARFNTQHWFRTVGSVVVAGVLLAAGGFYAVDHLVGADAYPCSLASSTAVAHLTGVPVHAASTRDSGMFLPLTLAGESGNASCWYSDVHGNIVAAVEVWPSKKVQNRKPEMTGTGLDTGTVAVKGSFPYEYYSYVGNPYDERLDVCTLHACLTVFVDGAMSSRNVNSSLPLEEELAHAIFSRIG